jgi:hypothetical protein
LLFNVLNMSIRRGLVDSRGTLWRAHYRTGAEVLQVWHPRNFSARRQQRDDHVVQRFVADCKIGIRRVRSSGVGIVCDASHREWT